MRERETLIQSLIQLFFFFSLFRLVFLFFQKSAFSFIGLSKFRLRSWFFVLFSGYRTEYHGLSLKCPATRARTRCDELNCRPRENKSATREREKPDAWKRVNEESAENWMSRTYGATDETASFFGYPRSLFEAKR